MLEPRLSASQRARVVERAKGGTNALDNLSFACQGCNNRKYTSVEAFDPLSQITVPLYHPRQHIWTEHFAWSDDGTLVLGLTSIGRAAIEKLQMNRVGLVNLRRVLVEAGEHPPVL